MISIKMVDKNGINNGFRKENMESEDCGRLHSKNSSYLEIVEILGLRM